MTRRTNARIAGIAYLFYIAVAFPSLRMFARATSGEEIGAKLANIATHATDLRVTVILSLLSALSALVLAVTLYAITRDQDRDVAMLGLTCRVGEGVINVLSIDTSLRLIWLATAAGADAPDALTRQTLTSSILQTNPMTGAFLFAVGSTAFCWLLLRGRMIPAWLAWVGFIGSALAVIELPLDLARFVTGPVTQLIWLPIAVFEIVVAFWFIIKGVREPAGAGRTAEVPRLASV